MALGILRSTFKRIFAPLSIVQICRSSNCLITKAFSIYSSGIKDTMEQEKGIHVIDVRSDTVTKPTPEMRQVMANAEVGDDVFGEDPTINSKLENKHLIMYLIMYKVQGLISCFCFNVGLQEKSAKLLGKEAGLFVPSGSMGNLISSMHRT